MEQQTEAVASAQTPPPIPPLLSSASRVRHLEAVRSRPQKEPNAVQGGEDWLLVDDGPTCLRGGDGRHAGLWGRRDVEEVRRFLLFLLLLLLLLLVRWGGRRRLVRGSSKDGFEEVHRRPALLLFLLPLYFLCLLCFLFLTWFLPIGTLLHLENDTDY